jgi:hypothetical protein
MNGKPEAMTDNDNGALRPRNELPLMTVMISLSLLIGAVSAWLTRSDMNPDGISYLDISDRWLAGDLGGVVNGYWSPLYPALLAAVRFVMRPAAQFEFRAAHVANFVVFVIGLITFSVLIRELLARSSWEPWRRNLLILWGYGLFLWSSAGQVNLSIVTPDLLVSASVWLVAFLALKASDDRPLFSAALGVASAIAFLVKSVMFPIGLVFLVAGIPRRRWLRAAIVSSLAFVCVAGPWIGSLSKQKGRFTFGDTGKLVYALYVDDVGYYTHWHGEPAGSGTPIHPTRKVFEHPTVYEFNGPVAGSYPPWDDPSYWNEGLRTHVDIRGHVRATIETVKTYYVLFVKTQWAFAGLLMLLVLTGWRRGLLTTADSTLRIGLPAVFALLLYAVLHVEGRYVGFFMVLLFIAMFLLVDVERRVFRVVSAVVVTSLLVATLVEVIKQYPTRSSLPAEWPVAAALDAGGLHNGDGVASVGIMIGHNWPRLLRTRVVAEVPQYSVDDFWNAAPETQQRVFDVMRHAGAKVVVGTVPSACTPATGWTRVSGTDTSFLFLDRH